MTLQERSKLRRKHMETHRASSFEEAERWDLEYWQRQSPEQRLSALPAIHRDVQTVLESRDAATG